MLILTVILIGVVLFGMAAGYLYNRSLRRKMERGELTELPAPVEVDQECCGQHEVCEKESLLAAVSKGIEYYDDEELDAYIGTAPEHYTPEEEEQFRDILYTMRDEEVAGWVRSLQLRGIALPNALKDEVYLIIGERRSGAIERH